MKKILLLLSCMVLLFVGIPSKYTSLSRLNIDGKYYLYIPNNPNPIIVEMGNACSLFNEQEKISAECISTTYTTNNLEYIQQKLESVTLYVEEVAGRIIMYAYSSKLKDSISIDGQKSNLQIVIYEDQLLVGYPIIYGGY